MFETQPPNIRIDATVSSNSGSTDTAAEDRFAIGAGVCGPQNARTRRFRVHRRPPRGRHDPSRVTSVKIHQDQEPERCHCAMVEALVLVWGQAGPDLGASLRESSEN